MKVKRLFLLTISIILSSFLLASFSNAKDVGGNINLDTTWTKADSPIVAVFSIIVFDGVTLTIEPGVEVRFKSGTSLGLVHVERLPEKTKLLPNYPNPFNPETWIPFTLAENTDVKIRIYDLQGRLVRELNLSALKAGEYVSKSKAVHWNGRNEQGEKVGNGMYICQLAVGEKTFTRRMVVLK